MPEARRDTGRRLGFFQLIVPSLDPETLVLGAADARHLRRSVRARPGDRVPATDGAGGRGEVQIVRWSATAAEVRPRLERREAHPRRRLWVATRAAEGRFDWLVEKAVELGAWGICPLRGVAVGADGVRDRHGRWQRLARAAVEQCGTAWLPVLESPRALGDLISEEGPPRFTRVILADPMGPPAASLSSQARGPGDHLLLAGPPEGFGGAERAALAKVSGLERVSLGPRRLRSETAALALLALVGSLPAPETPPSHP